MQATHGALWVQGNPGGNLPRFGGLCSIIERQFFYRWFSRSSSHREGLLAM
jgi:hypothetical protein